MFALLKRPAPFDYVRSIRAVFVRVLATGYLYVPELLLRVGATILEPGNAVYDIDSHSDAVYLILDGQFERSVVVALLLIAAHVHVLVVCSVVTMSVDQPGITMEVEDDRFVDGKETIEIAIAQTMWMFSIRLHLEQVDYIDEPNL